MPNRLHEFLLIQPKTYCVMLSFYFTKKKSSDFTWNEWSSRANLIVGVQLLKRLKKNQQAHGQQTNVAQAWQSQTPAWMAGEAQEFKSETSLAWKHKTICTLYAVNSVKIRMGYAVHKSCQVRSRALSANMRANMIDMITFANAICLD